MKVVLGTGFLRTDSSYKRSSPKDMQDVEERIEASVDRFREAHFYIHIMDQYYHQAEPFRWSLNSFLRSLKEIPQLLQMELQNEPGFVDWFRPRRDMLRADPLISHLSERRDYLVHRGMLIPASRGFIGITEGRGLKMGCRIPIAPLEDSDTAMWRYLNVVSEKGDVLELLVQDEESLPCIERSWRIKDFDEELVNLAARAWQKMGELVSDVIEWLGGERLSLSLDCRYSSQQIRTKMYDRQELRGWLNEISRRKSP